MLGNPPWERIKIQGKEWFAERRPDIVPAPNAAARKRLIKAIERDDPALISFCVNTVSCSLWHFSFPRPAYQVH